jgi:hypothetical protein
MPSTAFIHQGVSRVYLLPAVAVLTTPTRAEINAGVNLTGSLQSVGGFAIDNTLVEVAPVGAAFAEQTPGINKTTGPCTLSLYDHRTNPTIRASVAVGLSRYIILVPYGDLFTLRCEVWPVTIAAVSDTWENGVAVYRVLFAPRVAPTQNAVLPA